MKSFTLWTRLALDGMEFVHGEDNRYGIYATSEILTKQALFSGNIYIYRSAKEGGDIKSKPQRHD